MRARGAKCVATPTNAVQPTCARPAAPALRVLLGSSAPALPAASRAQQVGPPSWFGESAFGADLAQLACRNSLSLSTGTYSDEQQSEECLLCSGGLVSGPGATKCDVTCQAGTGTRTSNLRACVPCPIGAVNLATSLRTYCGTLANIVQSGALHCTFGK